MFCLTLVLIFSVHLSFSQSLTSKLDTIDGFFLIESYWDSDLEERRQLILPIDLLTYFGRNNVCYDYQFLDYSVDGEHSKRNEDFSRLLLNLLTGNTSSIEVKKNHKLKVENDKSYKMKYYIFYLKFTYKERGIIKKKFPKFNKIGKFKKNITKSVFIYDIVNILGYNGSVLGR